MCAMDISQHCISGRRVAPWPPVVLRSLLPYYPIQATPKSASKYWRVLADVSSRASSRRNYLMAGLRNRPAKRPKAASCTEDAKAMQTLIGSARKSARPMVGQAQKCLIPLLAAAQSPWKPCAWAVTSPPSISILSRGSYSNARWNTHSDSPTRTVLYRPLLASPVSLWSNISRPKDLQAQRYAFSSRHLAFRTATYHLSRP